MVFDHVFVQDREIRTQDEFTDRMQNKVELAGFSNIVGKLVQEIITDYNSINAELKRFPQDDDSIKDIRQQLSYLVYQGFLRCTPYEHLKAIPRYLKAIEYRMDRMFQEKQKDQQMITAAHQKRSIIDPKSRQNRSNSDPFLI